MQDILRDILYRHDLTGESFDTKSPLVSGQGLCNESGKKKLVNTQGQEW